MYDDPSSSSSAQEPAAAAPAPDQPHVSPEAVAGAPSVVDADLQPSSEVPFFPSVAAAEPTFYTIDSEEPGVAAPFQFSGAIPAPAGPQPDAVQATGTITPPKPSPQVQRPRWYRLLLWGLALLVVLLLLMGSIIGLAAPARSLQTPGVTSPTALVKAPPQKGPPSPVPTRLATGPTSSWSLAQLPAGWTAANLSGGDAAFAMRTAMTFTDREMSLDYRNVGTRGQHGATMTAATFLLTLAARTRFQQNDVRVINNVLFDRLAGSHLIQAVVDATPQLVQFQVQGGQQVAWVDVMFHLWQSRIDPARPGQRIEGLESDPASGQPRLHRMSVLLLRVAPGTQGPNAPMGGTGWLVSNYALDLAGKTVVDLVQPA